MAKSNFFFIYKKKQLNGKIFGTDEEMISEILPKDYLLDGFKNWKLAGLTVWSSKGIMSKNKIYFSMYFSFFLNLTQCATVTSFFIALHTFLCSVLHTTFSFSYAFSIFTHRHRIYFPLRRLPLPFSFPTTLV